MRNKINCFEMQNPLFLYPQEILTYSPPDGKGNKRTNMVTLGIAYELQALCSPLDKINSQEQHLEEQVQMF